MAIYGTNAADSLTGTDGSDEIDGLDGDDVIDGGAGDDTLMSGRGHNTFRFGRNDGHDAIRAFCGEHRPGRTGQHRSGLPVIPGDRPSRHPSRPRRGWGQLRPRRWHRTAR